MLSRECGNEPTNPLKGNHQLDGRFSRGQTPCLLLCISCTDRPQNHSKPAICLSPLEKSSMDSFPFKTNRRKTIPTQNRTNVCWPGHSPPPACRSCPAARPDPPPPASLRATRRRPRPAGVDARRPWDIFFRGPGRQLPSERLSPLKLVERLVKRGQTSMEPLLFMHLPIR